MQCAKILRMRTNRSDTNMVQGRQSLGKVVQSIDQARAPHARMGVKWPWAIVEDCIVVVVYIGDGLQKVVGPKPDLPNRLLRPCTGHPFG